MTSPLVPSGSITSAQAAQLEAAERLRLSVPIRWRGQSGLVYSSLPQVNQADKARVVRLLADEQLRLWEARGEILLVRDLLIAASEEEDPTSHEIGDRLRSYLITADGLCYQSPSPWVRKGLRYLVAVHGYPPWEPAVAIEVKAVPSRDRNKGPWLTVLPADVSLPANGIEN